MESNILCDIQIPLRMYNIQCGFRRGAARPAAAAARAADPSRLVGQHCAGAAAAAARQTGAAAQPTLGAGSVRHACHASAPDRQKPPVIGALQGFGGVSSPQRDSPTDRGRTSSTRGWPVGSDVSAAFTPDGVQSVVAILYFGRLDATQHEQARVW